MGKNYASAAKMQKAKKMGGSKAVDASIARNLFFNDLSGTEHQTVEEWLADEKNKITICKSKGVK